MRRTTNHSMASIGMLVLGCTAFVAVTSRARNAAAATTITVNGTCSLSQAISAVNTQKKVGGCAAGTGGDTIVVPSNSTTVVSSTLTITRSVTIQSPAAKVKALITSTLGSQLPWMFSISPAAGTPAQVKFVDITMVDAISGVTGQDFGNNTGIGTKGKNSTDSLTLTRCVFVSFGNSGVFATETSVTVTDSWFHDNISELGGGIRMEGASSNTVLTVSNSSFLNNIVDDAGGGIYDGAPGHATINNSSFVGNSADVGGGLNIWNGPFDVNGSTIAYNAATLQGAGGSGNANLTLTIVAGNTINGDPTLPSDWDFTTSINSLKDSLLSSVLSNNSIGGFGNITINSLGVNSLTNISADLVFGPAQPFGYADLQDLGGDMLFNPLMLQPLVSSPTIDAIPANSTSLTTDQRGYVRGVDVPGGNGSDKFDIGAYEYDPNIQAEDLFSEGTAKGTLSTQTGVSGFQPTSGVNGIKFTPSSSGASVTFRLPMADGGGGQGLVLHAQACPTCGTYQVAVQNEGANNPSFVTIGTQNFSASTTKNITTSEMYVTGINGLSNGFADDDVIDVKFTLASGSTVGPMVLDFINLPGQ